MCLCVHCFTFTYFCSLVRLFHTVEILFSHRLAFIPNAITYNMRCTILFTLRIIKSFGVMILCKFCTVATGIFTLKYIPFICMQCHNASIAMILSKMKCGKKVKQKNVPKVCDSFYFMMLFYSID